MNNRTLVKIFKTIGDYENKINKRTFPARALWKAGNALAKAPEILSESDIYEIDGIGKSSHSIIVEYLETGLPQRYIEALSKLGIQEDKPVQKNLGIQRLCEIPGIGSVKAEELVESGIKTKSQFYNTCKMLKIGETIPNTKITFTTAIWAGMEFEAHTDKNRMTIAECDAIANPLMHIIQNVFLDAKVMIAGSRRRGKDSIGDIDIIIAVDKEHHQGVSDTCSSIIDHTVTKGLTKVSGIKDRKHVDFRIVEPQYLGSMLLHATGSADLNKMMRMRAKDLGWKLSEYGLRHRETDKIIASETEEEIFEKLNMHFIQPTNRSITFTEGNYA